MQESSEMYYGVTDVLFWLFGVISFVAITISCYFPGWLVIRKVEFQSKISETVVSIVTGISFWALQGHVFGYLGTRYLTYAYILGACLLVWMARKSLISSMVDLWKEIRNTHILIWLAVLVSVFIQLYAHVFSGFVNAKGVGIYFVNSVDGVMHLSYIQSMIQQLPPTEPGFAGKTLENYHYWGDLVMAEFARIWHIPVIHLFFQYIPTFLILVTSLLVVQIVKALKGGTTAVLLSLFLFSFGGDASYIFSQYFIHTWGESVAALDSGPSFIFNMPQVFSRVVLLGIFSLFLHWTDSKKNFVWILIAVLGASLFNFKVYYGIYFSLGIGFLSVYMVYVHLKQSWGENASVFELVKTFLQKNRLLVLSFLVFVMVVTVTFLPHNGNSGGLFWEPLAWSKKFLSVENFNYQDWFLRMQVYEQSNNVRNIFIYNTVAILITLLSVYGVRLLGVLPLGKIHDHFPKELWALVIPANLIFILIGFLFLQTTGGFNIYNFLITPIVVFNIVAAMMISSIKITFFKYLMIFLLVVLSLPRSVMQLSEYKERYRSQGPDFLITNSELELFQQLRQLKPGVVQADPGNEYELSTPYVSFFSKNDTYLGGKGLIKINNDIIRDRETVVTKIFASTSSDELFSTMNEAGITYLYITTPEYIDKLRQLLVNSDTLHTVIENDTGIIISKI